MPARDARKLVSGFSAMVALLTENPVSVDDFIGAAEKMILTPESVPAARVAAKLIVDFRGDLEKSISRRRLAASVLPALDFFDVAVDLRFRFKDAKVEDAVPVAVVRIDTDAFNQQMWVQLALEDVDDVIRKLEQARVQMRAVGQISL